MIELGIKKNRKGEYLMKRILTVVTAVLLVALMAVSVCAADDIKVTLNGAEVDVASYGQPPVIENGRTLVPLRAIFEALGATVDWDQATKTVTSSMGSTNIELTIGADTMYVNGDAKALDVPGKITDAGRTLVPVRAVAEAYGVDVQWDAATRTVILTKSNAEPAPEGAILWNISGENFGTIEDATWGSANTGIQVVENPMKEGDKVLYIETNVSDKAAWNYFWFDDFEWVPGQRYVVTYSVLAGNDCFGNPVVSGTVGACYKYNNVDHGIGSGVRTYTDKWVNCAAIGTIPEDIDTTKGSIFGIFASPVAVDGYDHSLAYNLYIDNISLVPYNGDEEDGIVDPALFMGPTGSGLPANFSFDAAEGDLLDLSAFTSSYAKYDHATGNLVFDTESTDPLATIEVNIDAAEYSAVAVKFVKGEVGEAATSFQTFFTTASDPNLSESKSLHAKYIDCGVDADGSWVAYFDFANLETADLWTGTVTKIRLDPGNDYGQWDILGVKLVK